MSDCSRIVVCESGLLAGPMIPRKVAIVIMSNIRITAANINIPVDTVVRIADRRIIPKLHGSSVP